MTNADSCRILQNPADSSATVSAAIAVGTAARNPLVAPVIISDALWASSGESGAIGVAPAFLMEQAHTGKKPKSAFLERWGNYIMLPCAGNCHL